MRRSLAPTALAALLVALLLAAAARIPGASADALSDALYRAQRSCVTHHIHQLSCVYTCARLVAPARLRARARTPHHRFACALPRAKPWECLLPPPCWLRRGARRGATALHATR
jgi:hypothetical protein